MLSIIPLLLTAIYFYCLKMILNLAVIATRFSGQNIGPKREIHFPIWTFSVLKSVNMWNNICHGFPYSLFIMFNFQNLLIDLFLLSKNIIFPADLEVKCVSLPLYFMSEL